MPATAIAPRPLAPEVSNPPNERLLALLHYAKGDITSTVFTWRDVAKALGELYHPDMTLEAAMHHLVAAYGDLMADPRFECSNHGNEPLALLLAPVKGYSSVELYGPRNTEAAYTVEQFYNSMAAHMFSKLRLSRVDWLFAPQP